MQVVYLYSYLPVFLYIIHKVIRSVLKTKVKLLFSKRGAIQKLPPKVFGLLVKVCLFIFMFFIQICNFKPIYNKLGIHRFQRQAKYTVHLKFQNSKFKKVKQVKKLLKIAFIKICLKIMGQELLAMNLKKKKSKFKGVEHV